MGVKVTFNDKNFNYSLFSNATGWFFTSKGTLVVSKGNYGMDMLAEFERTSILSAEFYTKCCDGKGTCACK